MRRVRAAVVLGLSLLSALFVCGCPSDDEEDGAVPGNLSGSLYFNAEDSALHKVDLASGAHTLLGEGANVQKTPQGTFLGLVGNDLADAPESFATFRKIVTDGAGSDPDCQANYSEPRLSPDGTKVVFAHYGSGVICVVDFQTGAFISKIKDDKVVLGYDRPSWTTDGRLVFSGELGDYGIFITDATLQNPTRLDPMLSDVYYPRVSHDGKSVAFVKTKKVWKMGIDGSNPVQLDLRDDADAEDDYPIWSPDDTKIGYTCDADFCMQDASAPGKPVKLYKLYPDLTSKALIVSKSYSTEWTP